MLPLYLLLWALVAGKHTVSARELQVRLDLKPGEPKNGAFCTDDEKHFIVDQLAKTLSAQRNTDPKTFLPDQVQWCESLCMPYRITFCRIIQEFCETGVEKSERRQLLDLNEVESYFDDEEDDEYDFGEGILLFEDLDFEDEHDEPKSHQHVRRLFDTELSEQESQACKAEKKILTKKFSSDVQGQVQKSCMKLMRQKLRLTCGMF